MPQMILKTKIQKGAETNGLDQNMLNDLTGNITSEINSAKANLLGDTNPLKGITDSFSTEIDKTKSSLLDDAVPQVDKLQEEIEDAIGPIKRKM